VAYLNDLVDWTYDWNRTYMESHNESMIDRCEMKLEQKNGYASMNHIGIELGTSVSVLHEGLWTMYGEEILSCQMVGRWCSAGEVNNEGQNKRSLAPTNEKTFLNDRQLNSGDAKPYSEVFNFAEGHLKAKPTLGDLFCLIIHDMAVVGFINPPTGGVRPQPLVKERPGGS
ncbi:hypothetical protein TNCV_5137601, partial [Trichonephila clavipes]